MLYFNVLFRSFILNTDCDTTMACLDINGEKFVSHYQNILIVKELQIRFGDMYLDGKDTFLSYNLFIVTNISIDHHMDA